MNDLPAFRVPVPPEFAHAYDRLRAENAPPRYLYQPPRGAAHGAMLAMLRSLHRYPPLQATASAPGNLPLDDRILSAMGSPPITLNEAGAPVWDRFNAIVTAYRGSANL